MVRYAYIFFVMALLAAMYGFGPSRAIVAEIAKALSAIFLIGAIVTAFASRRRRE